MGEVLELRKPDPNTDPAHPNASEDDWVSALKTNRCLTRLAYDGFVAKLNDTIATAEQGIGEAYDMLVQNSPDAATMTFAQEDAA